MRTYRWPWKYPALTGLLLLGLLGRMGEAAEVILTVPEDVLDSRLATARTWRHCAPEASDAACLTTLADKAVPFLTLGHDANLAAVGVTVEVRR